MKDYIEVLDLTDKKNRFSDAKFTVFLCPKCNKVFDETKVGVNYFLECFPKFGLEKKECSNCTRSL